VQTELLEQAIEERPVDLFPDDMVLRDLARISDAGRRACSHAEDIVNTRVLSGDEFVDLVSVAVTPCGRYHVTSRSVTLVCHAPAAARR
jgi:hypothetical protein